VALQRELIDVDGRVTAVITGGDGDPLVFLHGGGIVEGFECFEPLTERFRFVAPQTPGFDQTDRLPQVGNIDELVAHTARTLDSLGIGSFALAGHSLGGWVAASLAAAHPDRTRSLVIAAPYGLDVPEHPIARVPQMEPAEVYATLTSMDSIWDGRLPPAVPAAEFEAAREQEGLSMAGFVPGPFDPALPAKLATLTMPILIQWGAVDRIVPPEHLPSWEAALPDAQVAVYPGIGHLLYHEHRPALEAIGAFSR
jgi:pimeloyl-ACP methyl ester carboxylesterase